MKNQEGHTPLDLATVSISYYSQSFLQLFVQFDLKIFCKTKNKNYNFSQISAQNFLVLKPASIDETFRGVFCVTGR